MGKLPPRRMEYGFLEKGGGMVTILAFEKPIADAPTGRQLGGKTVLLLADNPRVLFETGRLLRRG